MDKAKLDELARLQEDARKAPLAVTRDLDDGCALIDDRGVCIATTTWLTDARWLAAIHNSFPAILEYVRGLEGQIAQLRAASPLVALADASLAARDAQQRREGAATHLELMAELSKNDCMKNEYRAEAQRLREGK